MSQKKIEKLADIFGAAILVVDILGFLTTSPTNISVSKILECLLLNPETRPYEFGSIWRSVCWSGSREHIHYHGLDWETGKQPRPQEASKLIAILLGFTWKSLFVLSVVDNYEIPVQITFPTASISQSLRTVDLFGQQYHFLNVREFCAMKSFQADFQS